MSSQTRIDLENGKYTYVFDGGKQYALRHGEPWRDLLGDKFVYCLAHELNEARSELDSLKARSRTQELPDDVKSAINHALDLMSKHGDGFTSAGAMTVLQDFLDNPVQIAPMITMPPYGEWDNPGMGFPREWENYSSEAYRNAVARRMLQAGISIKIGDDEYHSEEAFNDR